MTDPHPSTPKRSNGLVAGKTATSVRHHARLQHVTTAR
jgi:hypothetical protein